MTILQVNNPWLQYGSVRLDSPEIVRERVKLRRLMAENRHKEAIIRRRNLIQAMLLQQWLERRKIVQIKKEAV